MLINKFFPSWCKLDHVQLSLISNLEKIACSLENKSIFDYFKNSSYKKHGIYLYGGVGRGKTMIMQAFYHRLNVKKRLIHYQEFMLSVHQNIHKLQSPPNNKIIKDLAKNYAKQYRLLCIDEFEIKDITDAMIIGKLFAELLKSKIFIFITSNTKPMELYNQGLQRESFLPFIEIINKEFEVLHLDNQHDYRLDKLSKLNNRILFPLNQETKLKIEQVTATLTDNNNFTVSSIEIFGRQILFKKTYKTVLITSFREIFLQELSYIDYVNICQKFTIIVLEDVPIINSDHTDLITRFINFIDNAYFHKVLLFITMQDAPEKIYQNGKRLDEFRRAVSRLHEMNSDSYTGAIYD